MRKGKTASSSSAKPKKPPVVNVVVLCGLPGSGKSTFATQVEDHNWVRVNQDDLGSCQECKKLMEKSLKKGKSVVIDRCNGSSGDRKMWLNEAKRLGVSADRIHVLHFATNAEDCIARVQKRQNHPTLQPERAEQVIGEFAAMFKTPSPHEGFATVETVTCEQEARQQLGRLKEMVDEGGGGSSSSSGGNRGKKKGGGGGRRG